jgi:hypothetical protein
LPAEGKVLDIGGRISAAVGPAFVADVAGSVVGAGLAGGVAIAGDGGIETALPPVAAERTFARRLASVTVRLGLRIAISTLQRSVHETAKQT